MSRTPSVGVILITYNEADRLERTLQSVRWADELVVVDSGSTDGTEAIARRYTARFVHHAWPGYGPQKQYALELATTDWVLEVDADEVVSPELREAIRRAVAAPGEHAGFTVERPMYYLGAWFGLGDFRRERKLRLVRRTRARFRPYQIHEGLDVDGPVGHLRAPLLHYSYRDMTHHVAKLNEFTSIIAQQRRRRGQRGGALAAVFHGWVYFFKLYLLQGGFLHGRAGLVLAALNGFNGFLKHAKLWELELQERAPPAEPAPARSVAER